MKFKPESERVNTKDVPEIEVGFHSVKITSYSPEVETARWKGAIVEFANHDMTGKVSEFISEKTAWKFSRLAKALGDDAVRAYRSRDDDGFSMFDPGEFVGECVTVEVVAYVGGDGSSMTRINSIKPAGVGEYGNPDDLDPGDDSPGSGGDVGDPQNLDDGRHDSGSDDTSDIPF